MSACWSWRWPLPPLLTLLPRRNDHRRRPPSAAVASMCRCCPLFAPDASDGSANGELPAWSAAVGVELLDPLRPPKGQRLEPLPPPDAAVGLLRSCPAPPLLPLRNFGSDSERSACPPARG